MCRYKYEEDLHKRLNKINNLINAIEKKLPSFPEGKLRVHHYKTTTSYYIVEEGKNDNGTLLKKDERKLAMELAQKAYYQKVLRTAKEEQKQIELLLRRLPDTPFEHVYTSITEARQKLVTPVVLPDDEYVRQWLNKPYTPKEFNKDDPYYVTLNGERVRSKSEILIADHLRDKNIPYKYECPIRLGSRIFYPDFTILRMSDRTEIYYEHLGMMDNHDYATYSIQKLNMYSLNGYQLGDRLFITMESSSCPYDVRILDQIIDRNFR